MSTEERLMILQMVSEKKITVEEAAELLSALDGSKEAEAVRPAQSERQTPSDPPRSSAPPSRSTLSGLGSFIEEIVDRVTSAVSEAVEPRYSFPKEMAGEFTADEVPIRIHTGHGKVVIRSWDQPGYKADILVKARGANENEAIQRAREAYTVKADEKGFDLEARPGQIGETVVGVTLMVPKGMRYRLEARTGNGSVELENITLVDSTVSTGNGRIHCLGGEYDRLALKSGNGSIEVEGGLSELEAESGNGAVTVHPVATRTQTLKLATGNGVIRVHTSRLGPTAGYRVEAHTGIGSVNLALGNLVYERDMRSMAHKQVIAHSQNLEQAEAKVTILARTGMGTITVD